MRLCQGKVMFEMHAKVNMPSLLHLFYFYVNITHTFLLQVYFDASVKMGMCTFLHIIKNEQVKKMSRIMKKLTR